MSKISGLKIITILAVIFGIYFSASIFADKRQPDSLDKIAEEYIMNLKSGDCYFPEEGMVPDAETAKKIAIAVWLPIYGEEEINKSLPPVTKLVGDSLWLVEGTYEQPSNGRIVGGGVPIAKIRKSTGEILCIIHGE